MSKESFAFLAAIVGLIWNTMQITRTLWGAAARSVKGEEPKTEAGLSAEGIVPIKRSTLKSWGVVSGLGLILSSIGFYLSLGAKSINTVVTLYNAAPTFGSIPFKQNTKVSFNIAIENLGPLPVAQMVRWDCSVGIVPSPETKAKSDEYFSEFLNSLKLTDPKDLYATKGVFLTRSTRQISEQDVRDLTEGRLIIYLFVYIKYKDTGGEHEAEVCRTLQPPGDADIWHECGNHNSIK